MLALLLLVGCGYFHATRPAPFLADPRGDAARDPPPPGAVRVYWIGHATTLVQIDDRWFLTDPVFSRRLGGIATRHVAPGIDPRELPRVTWVLISHAHLDHLDFPSLRQVDAETLAVPPGVMKYLPRALPEREIAPLPTWRALRIDGVRVTAVPSRHPDGRWFVDDLWTAHAHTGWVVEYHGRTVYFAGDTAYDASMFRAIRARFPHIDVALFPVGPAGETGITRWLSRPSHVDPDEAMRALDELGARWMVPIHFGTFFKSGRGELAAITRAIARRHERGRVVLLQIGQHATFDPSVPPRFWRVADGVTVAISRRSGGCRRRGAWSRLLGCRRRSPA